MKVPFFRPQIGEAEIAEVVDSLRNGWLTTGPKTIAFEKAFIEYLGDTTLHAVAVNSATAGLHLALEALAIGPGDEVIVPTYTFTATAEVVRYMGAEPVFVDVDYKTLNISIDSVRMAITPRTKAIMPVHFAGLSCDMDALITLARARDIAIVEDAAHALPTHYRGRRIGTLDTSAAIFSFYANKTITTGEGGMLVTRHKHIAERAQKMRLHGLDRDAIDRFKTGRWAYDVIGPGFKYNMTDIASSIGIHQLVRAETFRTERAELARRYTERLFSLPLDLPTEAEAPDGHAWHVYVIRVRPEAKLTRDQLFEKLLERGIVCSVHYTPLHKFSYWKDRYSLSAQNFPNAERAFEGALTLPLFPGMSDAEFDYVVESLSDLLR
jgi:dTDP-4-amino-4,6-dideoxygalactose transaminase